MIKLIEFYNVMTAMVPLYVAMLLGYSSVKWWKIFTPNQCSGINTFVGLFAIPLLSFHFISTNNPFNMNLRFILADTLQKLIILSALIIWANLSRHASLEWTITFFVLSTIPNTLVIGIPLLKGMYGEFSGNLMVQVVVLQCLIWYTLMLFVLEYRQARLLIAEQFPPETAGSIVSIAVDSDVISLDGNEVEAESEVMEGGKVHVTLRRSNSSISSYSCNKQDFCSARGRRSNFDEEAGVFSWSPTASPISEIYEEDLSPPVPTEEAPKDEEKLQGSNINNSVSTCHVAAMPPKSVMTRLILMMVWRKLIRNPNTYSSIIGLIWSLVSYRWNIEMPAIVASSISILSNGGLGMAMFSLGLFMALQARIIACGTKMATFAMLVRFIVGPAVMAVASIAIGLRGVLLHVAIVQAALPQGIVPFIFAKEYGVHADILSTAVIFGMLIALPITLVYYILLGL